MSKLITNHCLDVIRKMEGQEIDLTFLDPPFNQGKKYESHNDTMEAGEYWSFMEDTCEYIFDKTRKGGSIYFMHREKNAEQILTCLRGAGWKFQNLIIWKKMTSAVPMPSRYDKSYQVIGYAIKGDIPNTFNKLRIDPPIPEGYAKRDAGMFVTDIWDDIRELTSGYFAGDEPLRNENGERLHEQQSPLALLLRIILASSMPGDVVLDPFAGTGTTGIVAEQLKRQSILIDNSKTNSQLIHRRFMDKRKADSIEKFYQLYSHTQDLKKIWAK